MRGIGLRRRFASRNMCRGRGGASDASSSFFHPQKLSILLACSTIAWSSRCIHLNLNRHYHHNIHPGREREEDRAARRRSRSRRRRRWRRPRRRPRGRGKRIVVISGIETPALHQAEGGKKEGEGGRQSYSRQKPLSLSALASSENDSTVNRRHLWIIARRAAAVRSHTDSVHSASRTASSICRPRRRKKKKRRRREEEEEADFFPSFLRRSKLVEKLSTAEEGGDSNCCCLSQTRNRHRWEGGKEEWSIIWDDGMGRDGATHMTEGGSGYLARTPSSLHDASSYAIQADSDLARKPPPLSLPSLSTESDMIHTPFVIVIASGRKS